ncbi:glycosyltransferase family 9 protein [Pseudoalteromonas fenneropenaei]|uniref:Glycosyltransferase family 9 protein n=1 Tax=Pseudoalteromonas fenneropenaei TaxID=1737459 RepID=A0ABV7CPL3_9GAMM
MVLPKFIGDVINTLPAIALLKKLYPDSRIDLLVRPYLEQLLLAQPELGVNLVVDQRYSDKRASTWHKAALLRNTHYSLALLFRGSLSEALLCKLAGIKTIVGYAQNGRTPLLSHALKLNQNHHYIQRYCRLVNESHGAPFTEFALPQLQAKTSPLVDAAKTTIGCYFGGTNKGFRHYPTHLAEQVVAALAEQKNTEVVLLGDNSEAADNQAIVTKLGLPNVRNLAGTTALHELVDVVGNLQLLISIDSGPMHIAAACNTPCVAIVGLGTSPWSVVAPKAPNFSALVANGTSLDDAKLIEAITPAEIITAAQLQLAKF